jgi:hypothetical protein
MNMTSNGKTLNYKVVDLVENYNFYLHPSLNKKVTIFFKQTVHLPPWATAV